MPKSVVWIKQEVKKPLAIFSILVLSTLISCLVLDNFLAAGAWLCGLLLLKTLEIKESIVASYKFAIDTQKRMEIAYRTIMSLQSLELKTARDYSDGLMNMLITVNREIEKVAQMQSFVSSLGNQEDDDDFPDLPVVSQKFH